MMKNFKIVVMSLVTMLVLVSCGKPVVLSSDMLEGNQGYDALKKEVYEKYPGLKEGSIELMDFVFTGSMSSINNEKSSSMSFTMVKGDNKNSIINISLNNEGFKSSNLVDITGGKPGEQKIIDSYEGFKSALFAEKSINLELLREVRKKAEERFKKDANSKTAYCTHLSVERTGRSNDPKIAITITEEKPLSKLSRSYYYTLDGKETTY